MSNDEASTEPAVDRAPFIQYTALKDGRQGVGIGAEDAFLWVEQEDAKCWRFRLVNIYGEWDPQTAWIAVKQPGNLRTSKNAKILRDLLEMKYGAKGRGVLEHAIGVVQDNVERWTSKEQKEDNQRGNSAQHNEYASEDVQRKAQALLEDPLLLYQIKQDLVKWIVGEEKTSLLNFILDVSCKSKTDYAFQIISGDSSAGKSWLVKHVLQYLPPEWWHSIGRLSATALEYLNDQDFDLLWIQERRGGKEASDSVRLSAVDDGGTKVWVTERNQDTGRFETHEYAVPGRSIITTTTHTDIDAQDLTRSWLYGVDESLDQTRRIHDYEAREAKEPLDLREALGTAGEDLRPIVHEALKQLRWDHLVVVPYADELKPLVNPSVLRSRRDLPKLLRLVRVVTLLFQKQRPTFKIEERTFLVSFPQDAYTALVVGDEAFRRTARGLDQREEIVIDALNHGPLSRRQVARRCGKSMSWANGCLRSLVDKGYVDVDVSERTYLYSVRTANDENPSVPFFDRLNFSVLEKKTKTFLTRPCVTDTLVGDAQYSFAYHHPITGEKHAFPTTLTDTHMVSEPFPRVIEPKKAIYPSENDNKLFPPSFEANRGVLEKPTPVNTPIFEWKQVPLTGKCEKCGAWLVEYVITTSDGNELWRCQACFNEMRRAFPNIRFQRMT